MEKEAKTELKALISVTLVALIIGFFFGIVVSTKYFTLRVGEAVEMKRFLYNKTVYDIMPFDRSSK